MFYNFFYQFSDWWNSQRTVGGKAETPRYRWLQLSVKAKCNWCVVLKTLLCKWLLRAVVTKISETRYAVPTIFSFASPVVRWKLPTNRVPVGTSVATAGVSSSAVTAVNEVRENTSIKDIASVNVPVSHLLRTKSNKAEAKSRWPDRPFARQGPCFTEQSSGENNVFEEKFQTY